MPPFQWELTTSALIFEAFRIWEDLLLPYNSWVLAAGRACEQCFTSCAGFESVLGQWSRLCFTCNTFVAVWPTQQYPSCCWNPWQTRGALRGDTDNYTGAKLRINPSLIVRTSIRRIESAPPFSMHHISCLKICILTPEISSSWEK